MLKLKLKNKLMGKPNAGISKKSKKFFKKGTKQIKNSNVNFVSLNPINRKKLKNNVEIEGLFKKNSPMEIPVIKMDTFQSIGSIVWGMITKVNSTELYVKLPGGQQGVVEAVLISETYKTLLRNFLDNENDPIKNLDKMFECGERVCVRIIGGGRPLFKLSMMPKDIYKGLKNTSIDRNFTFAGAIQDEDDEKYVIETGIQNLSVSLPKSSARNEYSRGDKITCLVKKIEHSAFQSSATVKDVTNLKKKQSAVPGAIRPGQCSIVKMKQILALETIGTIFDGIRDVRIYGPLDRKIQCGDEFEGIVVCVTVHNIFVQQADKLPDITTIEMEQSPIFKCGDFVKMTVEFMSSYEIKGKVHSGMYAILRYPFISSTTECLKFGDMVTGRILNIYKEQLHLTNRFEYMRPDANILANIADAEKGAHVCGTIVKEFEKFYLVRFFNFLSGTISKKLFGAVTPALGQIFDFEIADVKDDEHHGKKIYLKLGVTLDDAADTFGEISTMIIVKHEPWGLEVVNNDGRSGYIPTALLSTSVSLSQLLLVALKDGDQIECVHLGRSVFSVRDVPQYREIKPRTFDEIEEGDIVRAYVTSIFNCNSIEVTLPIKGSPVPSVIVDLEKKALLSEFQPIYVKITERTTNSLKICTKLESVWLNDFDETIAFLDDELVNLDNGYKLLKNVNHPLTRFHHRQAVTGRISKIQQIGEQTKIKVDLNDDISGWLVFDGAVKHEIGDQVKCFVAWINFKQGTIVLTMRKIKMFKEVPLENQKGSIIASTPKLTIVQSNECGGLIFIPTRVHLNDFDHLIKATLKSSSISVIAFKLHDHALIGIPEDFYNSILRKNEEHVSTTKRSIDDRGDTEEETSKKKKSKKNKAESQNISGNGSTEDMVIPSISDFWNLSLKAINNPGLGASPSDNEDDDDAGINSDLPSKKMKLTPAERRDKFKHDEERLREIEEKLASSTNDLNSVDQFDRRLMSSPNESMIWIMYMAFHLQSTEIDKARAVAWKAFKTIGYREENEKLNVWIALLNLEIRYGNEESFNETLEEAIKVNDPYKIYSKCLEILVSCQKTTEANVIIDKLKKKFKAKPEMWTLVSNVYFMLGEKERAKKLLGRALTSLHEKEHVRTITQFALLMNRHGESEAAHAHLEQILASYPKRVDIWSVYVDMLTKSNEIDLARQTLDRAITQKLPVKKMRPLYKKFLDFEKKFGTEENVQKVKKLAEEFVSQIGGQ